jgi:lipoic acid synthetase
MDDLRDAGVSLLTLGQYLRPTLHHLPVVRWVPPEDFERYREAGLARGFREVASGPLVRSSYRADRVFAQSGGALPTLVTPPVAEGLIPLRTLNSDS